VNRSTIAGNSSGAGGGIDNQGQGVLTVIDSTISGNHANTFGGGILNNSGTATIVNSTISGNSTQLLDGGGIFTQGGTLTVTNSTFSGNSATGSGGGIFHFATALTITNSTLSGNSAGKTGGGINDLDSNGVTTSVKSMIHNTIIAGNRATGGGVDVFGSFTSQGFNLIGDGTGSNGFTNFVNGDLVGTPALPIDAKLGTLQDNGGATFTMAPLAGSPVIDRGDPINFPITDQRGILRPAGTRAGSVAKRGTEGIIGELNFLWLEPNGISRSV
jgi:predicted outer membrane repeat protein